MSTSAGCTVGKSTTPLPVTPPERPAASPPVDARVLSFDFDELGRLGAAGAGSGELILRNTGSEPVTVRVSSVGGATLRPWPDREGGYAARFPGYDRRTRQRLVVTATSASVTDPMGPGTSDFTFGADFAVDTVTEEAGLDSGNNLIQRGLSGDLGQYKLQIDQGRASCLVVGDAGEVKVRTTQRIRPHTWYRVSCRRTGPVITLSLNMFGGPTERAVGPGDTGAVYVPAATPLVLGGKATSSGEAVVSQSDQFNGTMDNVFLQIDEDS